MDKNVTILLGWSPEGGRYLSQFLLGDYPFGMVTRRGGRYLSQFLLGD